MAPGKQWLERHRYGRRGRGAYVVLAPRKRRVEDLRRRAPKEWIMGERIHIALAGIKLISGDGAVNRPGKDQVLVEEGQG